MKLLWLAVGLAVGLGCSINHRSGDFACDRPSDCSQGRTCTDGFCVAPADAGARIDAASLCPSQCTTCSTGAKLCTIDCALNGGACNQLITCPTGWSCNIVCSTSGACRSGINCLNSTSCAITCAGAQSCRNVNCGPGRCSVDCSGPESCRMIGCGTSCACDITCSAGAQCEALTCKAPQCRGLNGCTSSPAGCNTCLP